MSNVTNRWAAGNQNSVLLHRPPGSVISCNTRQLLALSDDSVLVVLLLVSNRNVADRE